MMEVTPNMKRAATQKRSETICRLMATVVRGERVL